MQEQFERVWPLLKQAADRSGTFSKDYVRGEIESGRSLLISNADSALVFTARPVPDGRLALYMWLTAGTRNGVVDLVRTAEEWGRAHGCVLAATDCRPGGQKLLPDYRLNTVTLTKEL